MNPELRQVPCSNPPSLTVPPTALKLGRLGPQNVTPEVDLRERTIDPATMLTGRARLLA